MQILVTLLLCIVCLPYAYGKEIPITLEFASSPEEIGRGLMHRKSLEPDHGMLFSFSKPQKLSFWMYNTWIDLSIAFLDQNRVIREIYEMKSYPEIQDAKYFAERSITSTIQANYALEMNKNWFNVHHVKPGDQVSWDVDSGKGYIFTNP